MAVHILLSAFVGILALFTTAGAAAQSSSAERKPFQTTIKPVLIDSASQASITLGIDYDIEYLQPLGGSGRTSQGQPIVTEPDTEMAINEGELSSRLRGTLASSREKNPNKFVDLSAAWHYRISTVPAWYYLGAGVTYETDQSFENKQFGYGFNLAVSKVSILKTGDAGTALISVGRINPKDDTKRKSVEGKLDSFARWNLELSYTLNVNQKNLSSIDFNYRHYQELSPSSAIKTAGLDRNHLALIRLNHRNDYFVQYSFGSLPFDQKSERAVKIGWTAKFD